MSNLLPTGVLIAERTLFLPSIGAALVCGGLLAWIMGQADHRWRRFAMGAVGSLIITGAIRCVTRAAAWRDTRSLTLASMEDAPRSWRVQQAYAELKFFDQEIEAARVAYERAIELAPERWRPRNLYAQRLWQIRADREVLDQLEQSLAESPGRIETLTRIPAVLLAVGRYADARRLADSILAVEGDVPIMRAYRVVADSALKLKAPIGSVRIFPNR